MDNVAYRLVEDIKRYLISKTDHEPSTTMTEEHMFQYLDSLLKNLCDLPQYCTQFKKLAIEIEKKDLQWMSEYKILQEVCGHLRDFIRIKIKGCFADKRTEYLSPQLQLTADKVRQFCFDLWISEHSKKQAGVSDDDDDDHASFHDQILSNTASLLFEMIPVQLEVLYICSAKLKDSWSIEVEAFVKQLLGASPRILQIYLIHLQGRMVGLAAVNTPTQSINVMIEFLLIIFTDISNHIIPRDKLNDFLAHTGLLTREISIAVGKLDEKLSPNEETINSVTPNLLHKIEQMKVDLRNIYLNAPESSQICFPVGDGLLFMNLLLRHLNDLLNSKAYSVALIKQEIGTMKEALDFLTSHFRKARPILNENGLVKDLWRRSLDVAYEVEHVINSILVRNNGLSHLIFSLPGVIEKIKLILAEVKSLPLKDIHESGDVKTSDKPTEPKLSSVVEVTVGFEKEAASIIYQLTNGPAERDVISIIGMPGLGKSTLANKVYKNTLVADHFDVLAWCTRCLG